MEYKLNTNLPILFEKTSRLQDSRFTPVKIWLAHTGRNLHGSIFTKDVLAKMARSSLSNVPILGFLQIDEFNKTDFKGHEMKLVISDNGIELIYMGKAYGLIPEKNNHRFETKVCSDGIEREWLVCDGLLWNKSPEAVDIFERDGSKGQSMELEPGSIAGTFNKDGDFVFSDAKFEGACILGSVQPAMISSVIETFSANTIKQQLQEMLSELQAYQKGSDKVETTDVKVEEQLQNEVGEVAVEKSATDDSQVATDFALSHGQLLDEIRRKLHVKKYTDEWGREWNRYWYFDHDDTHVWARDDAEGGRLYGFTYSVSNDVVIIAFASKFPVKIVCVPLGSDETYEFNYVPKEYADALVQHNVEKTKNEFTAEIEEKQSEFTALQSERNELLAYKNTKLNEERQSAINELFAEFSTELSEDELAQVRATVTDQSVEEIRESLFALVGKKKAKFSATPKKQTLRVPLGGGDDKANVGGKSWGYLVEQTLGKRD